MSATRPTRTEQRPRALPAPAKHGHLMLLSKHRHPCSPRTLRPRERPWQSRCEQWVSKWMGQPVGMRACWGRVDKRLGRMVWQAPGVPCMTRKG